MKKKIILRKIDSVYLLLDEEDKEILKIENKIISGKDIYENIYLKQLETGFVEVDLKTDLEAKEDQIIYKHLKILFEKIDVSIQEMFKTDSKNVIDEKEKITVAS